MATLLSVNVGMPKDVSWRGRTVHTGVWKSPVAGPRMVRRLNIDGDGQGDLAGHGGEQRAVLVYQIESYRHWQEFFGRDDLEHGAFGENFTVEGLGDDEVCIGDRYRIGEAEFEVTQPRVTCFRVGMRMGEPQLPVAAGRPPPPGVLPARPDRGPRQRRRRDRAHRARAARAERGRRRRAALPARARPRAADGGPGHPGPEPGLAASRSGACWTSDAEARAGRRRGRATAGLGGLPHPHRHRRRRRERVGDVVPVRRRTTRCRRTGPASSSPSACPAPATRSRCGRYSLSGDPDGGRYRISVKRESHGLVSSYLHAHLRRGDRIEVAAPRGDFVLDEGTEPVLLISAGIGLTPVLAMLHRLASEQQHARGVVDPHHPRRATATRSPPRSPTCSAGCRRRTPSSTTRRRTQPLAPDCGRPGRTAHRGGDRRPGPPGRRERVRLRPGVVHGRRRGRPRRRRHRPGAASTPSGSGRGRRSTPASSATDAPPPHQPPGPPGHRPGGDLRALGAHRRVVGPLLLGARARRGVRRPDAVVVPHRRLPHLRHGGAVGRGVVRRRRRSSRPATTSCSSARPGRPRTS